MGEPVNDDEVEAQLALQEDSQIFRLASRKQQEAFRFAKLLGKEEADRPVGLYSKVN